jgi:hypothetical protein
MATKRRLVTGCVDSEQQALEPVSCPDCSGVLSSHTEGPRRHRSYHCQIDRRYSTRSLLQAKERQLENTLWSVVVLMKHLEHICEELVREIKPVTGAERIQIQRRMAEVSQQQAAIQAMIEAAHALD